MNDRFRFRAWDKEQKRMFYNAEMTYDYSLILDACEADSFGTVLTDDNMIVMQCTGLKDKNDKLIYEGDIIKYTSIYSGNLTGEVYWDSETLQYKLKLLYSSGEIYADRDLVYFVNKNGLEKVGNIYENKELLEE